MIIELGRLEELMLEYKEPLRELSKTIRNKIWRKSDEKRLATVLNACNQVFPILIDVVGADIAVVEMYIEYLQKHSNMYSSLYLNGIFDDLKAQISIYKTQELVKEHWRQLNPYFRNEYSKEDLLSKDLIAILDDFYENIIGVCADIFLLSMNDMRFQHLLRGRRGTWQRKEDMAAPTIEIAKKYNIVNRWNPPEKRYLYLVAGNGSDDDVETSIQEMRIKAEETVTITNFHYLGDLVEDKIVDLDYEQISRDEIFEFADAFEKNQVQEIISEISSGNEVTPGIIRDRMQLKEDRIRWMTTVFAGKILLKEISEAIFVPLDDAEDNDKKEKDKCYKAFHVLAEYFESKGFAGITYPSTRMKLIGKSGSNLVLFNADSAEAVEGTFSTFVKEG
jgi:hypothetical protein